MPIQSIDNPLPAPGAGGEGKIGVLLIHGLTGTPTEMSPIERYLRKRGFKVEVPLLAGHAASNDELLATRWEDWAESARPALRSLASECDAIFVGGTCMGAMLSIVLANEEPKVKGVIAISMDAGYPAKGSNTFGFLLPLGFMLPLWMQKRIYWVERPPYGIKDPDLQAEITFAMEQSKARESKEHGTFRTYVASFKQLSRLRAHCLKLAPQVRCAALVLHSAEDTLMDPKNAKIIFDRLGSERKNLCYLSGCDHVMTVDLRRKDVAGLIYSFALGVAGRL